MKSEHAIQTTCNAGRTILSMVLLLSGSAKLLSLQSFADEVAKYTELYISESFVPWSSELAVLVCIAEIALGAMLLFKSLQLLALSAILAMMTFFLYLTSANYLFPTMLGSVESCGCFGELIHFTALGSFIKSIVLWLLSLATLIVRYLVYLNKRVPV